MTEKTITEHLYLATSVRCWDKRTNIIMIVIVVIIFFLKERHIRAMSVLIYSNWEKRQIWSQWNSHAGLQSRIRQPETCRRNNLEKFDL